MTTAVAAIVMLGVLVFIHELGHFIAFKAIGVKVLKFSLGYPPAIICKKYGETEYQIGLIPLGGYVKALGEEGMEGVDPGDRGRSLMERPVGKRIMTFVAGPLMNIVFPVFLYWIIFAIPGEELSPRIGGIVDGMPAGAAGIVAGDLVTGINGKRLTYWSELQDEVSSRPGKPMKLSIDRGGQRLDLELTPELVRERDRMGGAREVGRIGIMPFSIEPRVFVTDPSGPAAAAGVRSWDLVKEVNGKKAGDILELQRLMDAAGSQPVTLRIERQGEGGAGPSGKGIGGEAHKQEVAVTFAGAGGLKGAGLDPAGSYVQTVDPGSPAEAAGLSPGDKVTTLDGRPVTNWGSLEDAFRREPEREFALGMTRGGNPFSARVRLAKKTVTNEFKQDEIHWTLGAHNPCALTGGQYIKHGFQPARALSLAVESTVDIIVITYTAVYKLFTGSLPLHNVGGPIMIFDMAGTVAKKGMTTYLWFMALISINLGIFNLLPIPVLDGGHVLLSLIEVVTRRPVSQRFRLVANYIGLAFLGFVFVLVFKNDIQRYFLGGFH